MIYAISFSFSASSTSLNETSSISHQQPSVRLQQDSAVAGPGAALQAASTKMSHFLPFSAYISNGGDHDLGSYITLGHRCKKILLQLKVRCKFQIKRLNLLPLVSLDKILEVRSLDPVKCTGKRSDIYATTYHQKVGEYHPNTHDYRKS